MKKEYISPVFEEENIIITTDVLSTSGQSDQVDYNDLFGIK